MKRYLWLILILVFVLTPRLWADDTDIYGTTTITMTPNVLIIFDTSLSMDTADIQGDAYNPGTEYSGIYSKNAVYRKSTDWWGHASYTKLVDDYHSLNCSATVTDLGNTGSSTNGVYRSRFSQTYQCSNSTDDLHLGNWINYDQSGGSMRTRMEVAKDVIKNLIDNTENVRFGLMRFNQVVNEGFGHQTDQGGYLVARCGTDKETLKNDIDGFTATDYTPLAETLAEAGLYFAGKKSWFNGSDGKYSANCSDNDEGCYQYSSPMQYRCQKNYIIIMTDGAPTYDDDPKLVSGTYINGDHIGDYDHDGKDYLNDPGHYDMNGTDYLDDVAKYLYENDLNPNLGTAGESFEKQNVVVYTIGFKTEQPLLSDTALNGGGRYYTANSISGLSSVFNEIIADIADVSAVFVSPVVPVSRMNRTYAGNSLYVGFFKPEEDGRWAGNIKKYGIDSLGRIVDADGIEATLANGAINENARSFWSTAPDGPNVLSGGVGQLLLNQDPRHLYTYTGSTLTLTDSTNAFLTSNTAITAGDLGVSDSERDAVINDIGGMGRSWVLGDILHSRPAVVHYDTDHNGILNEADDAFIFAGSNDGMMHCFKDSDGSEVWGFIPPDLLPRLKELSDGTTNHKYFVDGVPKVYEGNDQKILFFGERRGGDNYYALDVTTYDSPVLKYAIEPTFLVNIDGDGDGAIDSTPATLGQSWSEPTVHTIKASSGSDFQTVFLMAGGYDKNQDKPPYDPVDPLASRAENDTEGRAVYTINVTTGAVGKLDVNAGNYSEMTHCIVDVSGFDSNGNGITNRVYAGDLGGNVFAFEDDNGDGTWSRRKLFSAPIESNPVQRRKIFYAPDAVEESYGEMIFFGTGDRADPEGTSITNRIYAIKNHWEENPATLTESDLYNATDDLVVLGNASQQTEARTALANGNGWYIELNQNAGEKVTSPMTVFNGVLYFTTYTPESGPPPDDEDPCEAVSGRGQARLYALNYKTGEAAFDWSNLTETDQTDEHNVVNKGRLDRSKVIGTSIASAPVIAILEGGPQIYIGVEGGVKREDPQVTQNMETFFWRQLNN
jgi:type IV pilus assembly protein PilY1